MRDKPVEIEAEIKVICNRILARQRYRQYLMHIIIAFFEQRGEPEQVVAFCKQTEM
ncbi:hypothetical protein J6590_009178 [Homalodisca vitripennis]|nr:hypothetical protein J6590_009178 [Homalodisca vitripennis]